MNIIISRLSFQCTHLCTRITVDTIVLGLYIYKNDNLFLISINTVTLLVGWQPCIIQLLTQAYMIMII